MPLYWWLLPTDEQLEGTFEPDRNMVVLGVSGLDSFSGNMSLVVGTIMGCEGICDPI